MKFERLKKYIIIKTFGIREYLALLNDNLDEM